MKRLHYENIKKHGAYNKNQMFAIQIVGFVASILGAATFLPEVLKACKTYHLKDVAWGMLLLLVVNSLLWVVYASYFGILPVLLSALLNFVMGAILVVIKWRSERKCVIQTSAGTFRGRLITD